MKKKAHILLLIAFLLFRCEDESNQGGDLTNIILLQQLTSQRSNSTNSTTPTTPPSYTNITLGTQATGTTKSTTPIYFKLNTSSASTYYYGVYGKSQSSPVTFKIYNSTTTLDNSTLLKTTTSGNFNTDGLGDSIALDASKEYAIEITTTRTTDLSFQIIVTNDHLSGSGSCIPTGSNDCFDYPSGATGVTCPALSGNYSTSSCSTRFPAKTIVGRCTWIFAEGSNTAWSKTFYNDGTYPTNGAASTSCSGAARARYFTNL